MAAARALAAAAFALRTTAQAQRYVPDTASVCSERDIYQIVEEGQTYVYTLHQQPLADLVLPSGAIVASDTFVVNDMAAFQLTRASGSVSPPALATASTLPTGVLTTPMKLFVW